MHAPISATKKRQEEGAWTPAIFFQKKDYEKDAPLCGVSRYQICFFSKKRTNIEEGDQEDHGEVCEHLMIESKIQSAKAGQRVKLISQISVC
jgi:hypothetical protein